MENLVIFVVVVIVVIIVVIVLLCVWFNSDSNNNKNKIIDKAKNLAQNKKDSSDKDPNQNKANLSIFFINMSNQISNFLQQIKFCYKGLKETFSDLGNIYNNICVNIYNIYNLESNDDLYKMFLSKNETYGRLASEIMVDKKDVRECKELLESLNKHNVQISDKLASITNCKEVKNSLINLLHTYDVLVILQMNALIEKDYSKFIILSRKAQNVSINIYLAIVSKHRRVN